MGKVVSFSNKGQIDPTKVKVAVYNRIDFELPQNYWEEIDDAFRECWNVEIGIRGWVHERQIEDYIYNHLKIMGIIFEYEKVERVV